MSSPPLLHHERVTGPDADPERWIFLLHGIYGAGRNWGSVARRLVGERPEWGAVLVDLRQHGESMGFPGPHTLEAAAGDLQRLVSETGLRAEAVLGHSFGGKVALVYARDAGEGLRSLWVVDSTPDARPPSGSAWRMLETLRRHPGPFRARGEAIEAVVSDGFDRPVGQWMATNLEADEAGAYRWRLDADEMEELLRDFFDADLWSVLEAPPAEIDVHMVKASRSSVMDDDVCRRVEDAVADTGRAHLHRVEGGHWLNADNPTALVDLLDRWLPPSEG